MQKTTTNYTTTTPFMRWCSYKIKPRADRQKNGNAPLVLQMFIDKQKIVLDIGVTIPIEQWDPAAMQLRGKTEIAEQTNILIQQIRSNIHNIQLDHRLAGKPLTAASFKQAYQQQDSREDFIAYMHQQIHTRYSASEITNGTYKMQIAVQRKLQACFKKLPFSEISPQTLETFRRHLNKHYAQFDLGSQQHHTASIHGQFKVFKTYIKMAAKNGLRFADPFINFKIPAGNNRLIYLSETELQKMVSLWRTQTLPPPEQYALTVFLFACYTSLRISDIKQLSSADIFEDHIIIRPQKTIRINKTVRIPLNTISRQIIQGKTGIFFTRLSEQKINRYLKNIAALLDIKKKVSMHVGRHTFATEFLRRGGHLHVLQKIMGHADIKTTMVYTHLEDNHLTRQMQLMDD